MSTMTVPAYGHPDYVGFATGKAVELTPPDQKAVGAAFQKYAAEFSKYPDVQTGFNLTYPVPEDLLLPFGQFVEKYSLGALVPAIFAICQGYTPLLEISTLYVFKYLNTDLLNSLSKGFLTTERSNTGELYEKAANELASDAMLNVSVVAMDRSSSSGLAIILVQTTSGRKLILAKKVVFTIPLKLDNLHNFDLSTNEKLLFGQYYNSAYYAGVLRDTCLPTNTSIHAVGTDKPYAIPDLPGIYTLSPNSATGLVQVCYGSPHALSEDQVQADIIAAMQRIQKARGISATTTPEFVAFANHTPFNMMVSNDAIKNGSYEKLYALQGQRNTFYNGVSFHAQDSPVLWRFTEQLLPRILAELW
ncbi:hypothetical protein MMC08_000426 [Hypocenomyce scalaris]|nr:hypothetical protein [Hypocenomyce scalaris]